MKLILLLLLFFTQNVFALSLSGDDWKNPLRTKTWNPPSESDTLIGKKDVASLNVLTDGSFEKFSTPVDWTASSTSTVTMSIVNTDFVTPRNAKMLSITGTGIITAKTTFATPAVDTDMSCRMKVYTSNDIKIQIFRNAVMIVENTVKGQSAWQDISAGFTSNGDAVECRLVSTGSSATIMVEDAFFGYSNISLTANNLTFSELELPNKQATKTASNRVRLETGNDNLLINPIIVIFCGVTFSLIILSRE